MRVKKFQRELEAAVPQKYINLTRISRKVEREDQEAISNSNIMRVKKFQRELEAAEGRANEAESSLNSFRSQQRVFAAAAESRRDQCDPCADVVIRKNIVNVAQSSANTQESRIVSTSQTQNASSSSALESSASASRSYRAGSTMGASYSRAGSMARSSMARQSSMGRATSMLRY